MQNEILYKLTTEPSIAAYIDDKQIGEVIFAPRGDDTIVIESTHVNEEYQGQNVGTELVKHVVEYARHHNLRIIPMCRFALAAFSRHPEWNDVRLGH